MLFRSILLRLGGIATLAEVRLNGERILESNSMFASYEVNVSHLIRDRNELLIACYPLTAALRERRGARPAARWRTRVVSQQQLRWFRTTLLGRAPGDRRWRALLDSIEKVERFAVVIESRQTSRQRKRVGIRQRIERRSLPAMRLCAPSASRKPRNATDPPPTAFAVTTCRFPKSALAEVSEPVMSTPSHPRNGASSGKPRPDAAKA